MMLKQCNKKANIQNHFLKTTQSVYDGRRRPYVHLVGAPNNTSTMQHICRSSFFDQPSHEEIFYIFHIGKYQNCHHFTLGRTHDIMSTELKHTHTLPVATCVYQVPIGRYQSAVSAIYKLTRAMRTHSPVIGFTNPDNDDNCWIIMVDSYQDINPLLEKVDILFNTNTRFDIN